MFLVIPSFNFIHLTGDERHDKQCELLKTMLPATIPDDGRIDCEWHINAGPVCGKTFQLLYNMSDHYIRNFKKRVKQAKHPNVNTRPIRSFTDATIPDYSWNEMEAILGSNLVDEGVAEDMVRGTGTPLCDDKMTCSIWLRQYFDMCDQSPNSRHTYVNVSEKSEVYETYAADMHNLKTTVLSKNVFLDLWSKLWPHCVKRPRCDIPGA